ncbi:Epimerase family protein [Corynebacterium ciconiae DSM 44920]|uniref:TIGR01777 family oxidoreductase n=1 Tax=Corynebacterium ciconiae TaxID=227319 RepID=UPI000379E74A|nr:TIGR01777 family oxidoreductase [Corynebacterium ciconiae]WKD61304.1 Epimerase family protein [Corynebacterium ciconiae DSM 44920]
MGISTEHVLPFPRSDVWQWHTRPGAVVRLTPPFVPMTPVKQASSLATGTTEFSLPAGLKWVAKHDLAGYHEGRQFTDVCVNAPMRVLSQWRHVHAFADDPAGTRITDTVHTRLPGSFLEAAFAYRQHQLLEDLTRIQEFQSIEGAPAQPLTIALTGSGGLVGTHLGAQLRTAGHTVIELKRGSDLAPGQRRWHTTLPDEDLLEGVDVLIHLAGESIAGRMSETHREKIRHSRITPTRRLAELVAASKTCTTMVVASAVGFYGPDRGDELLDENAERGEGFLADVVADWEDACAPAREAGARVVNLRTGLVMSAAGGILPGLRAAFAAGLAPQVGTEGGYLPWVSIDDLTSMYIRAALDPQMSGPFNATGPAPVRSEEFSEALQGAMHRKFVVPIPAVAPKLVMGPIASEELLMTSQNAVPAKFEQLGHRFTHNLLPEAFAHELGGEALLNTASTSEA